MISAVVPTFAGTVRRENRPRYRRKYGTCPRDAADVPGPSSPEARGMDDPLTAREREVVKLVALGHTSAEIASILVLSRRTVEMHRAHAQRKLGVRTRAALV